VGGADVCEGCGEGRAVAAGQGVVGEDSFDAGDAVAGEPGGGPAH